MAASTFEVLREKALASPGKRFILSGPRNTMLATWLTWRRYVRDVAVVEEFAKRTRFPNGATVEFAENQ